jgi:glycosyltransferase involved in cell wall biosynthesis
MTTPAPDLIQRALREGWIDPVFLAARLGLADPAQLDLPHLLADPAQHALALSPRFDGGAYLERYRDVAAAHIAPLAHFLRFGQAEGRSAFADYPTALAGLAVQPGGLWVESHDLGLTGAPLALAHLLAGLVEMGHLAPGAVRLGAPCDGPLAPVMAQALGGGLVVQHGQAALRVQTLAQADAMQARCAALLARAGVGRVLANSIMSWPMALAAQRPGLPLVWIVHEPSPDELRANFPAPLCEAVQQALHAATHLVFVAESSRAAWGAARHPRAQVIAKALPPPPPSLPAKRDQGRALAQCDPGDVLVLSVGTFSPRKGQMDLIQALGCLAQHPVAARLVTVLVGDVPSPYGRQIQAQAQALRARGLRVQLWPQSQSLPQRQQVEQLFAAADLCVTTSRAESLPLTLSEALAAGCPVVTTDLPGIRPLVIEGATGLVYPPGQGADLADHLVTLAENPDLRARMRAEIAARTDPAAYQGMITAFAPMLHPRLG